VIVVFPIDAPAELVAPVQSGLKAALKQIRARARKPDPRCGPTARDVQCARGQLPAAQCRPGPREPQCARDGAHMGPWLQIEVRPAQGERATLSLTGQLATDGLVASEEETVDRARLADATRRLVVGMLQETPPRGRPPRLRAASAAPARRATSRWLVAGFQAAITGTVGEGASPLGPGYRLAGRAGIRVEGHRLLSVTPEIVAAYSRWGFNDDAHFLGYPLQGYASALRLMGGVRGTLRLRRYEGWVGGHVGLGYLLSDVEGYSALGGSVLGLSWQVGIGSVVWLLRNFGFGLQFLVSETHVTRLGPGDFAPVELAGCASIEVRLPM